MAIQYIHPATGETTNKERWHWQVIYKDGTILDQFSVTANGAVFHRFAEIDQSRLGQLRLVQDNHAPIIIDLPDGAKPVHFYTTAVIQIPTPDGEHTITSSYKGYKFGYRYKGNDYGVLINHDDSIHIINDFKAANLATGE